MRVTSLTGTGYCTAVLAARTKRFARSGVGAVELLRELAGQAIKLLHVGNRSGVRSCRVRNVRERAGDGRRRLQNESRVIEPSNICRPRHYDIGSRGKNCQMRLERQTEYRAIARRPAICRRSKQSVAR